MMRRDSNFICFLVLSVCLALYGHAFGAAGLLPEGLTVQDGYTPGYGEPIGQIDEVRGTAVIIHPDATVGYRAAKNLPVYKNDTLVTLEDGHLGVILNDGSFLSLSPKTRLQINKSVYAPEQKTRSSFMDMALGKARFVVQKLVDAKHSEFKVKTKTSVAGVRGSDFIILATEELTEVTALSDTVLEVASLATPAEPPLVLTDYRQTRIQLGAPPTEPQELDAREVERLMKEFKVQPPEMSGPREFTPADDTGAWERGAGAGLMPEEMAGQPGLIIPEDELVAPGSADAQISAAGEPSVDFLGDVELMQSQQEIQQVREIQDQVVQETSEEQIIEQVITLPEFPQMPR